MTAQDLISRYNYDAFVPENFEPWLNFEESPPLGRKGPDFPLWGSTARRPASASCGRSMPTPSSSSAASPDRTAGWRRHLWMN